MGIQAYDYKTGSQLWAAAFDFTPTKTIGKPGGNVKAWGVYGAVAEPLVVGRDVYVLDMGNRKNQYLKKYDINSGRLLWTSPEIKGAKAIPNMYLIDDVVVLQIGGAVELQYITHTKDSDGNITIRHIISTKNVKPTGVQAFSASDGKAMWDSERFKKGITNMMESDGSVIVCSGKALYKMDVKTGAEQYEVDVKADGIGLTEMILPWKDQIIIVSDKGVSSHNVSDGQLKAVNKYKKSGMEQILDNKLIMKTSKDDIACYDLDSIKYREYNARKGAVSHLMEQGKYVYVYEKKTLTKLSTD
ncbi:MAG: PQQ-binding-like beta-propeller repeat protein, partial [Flavobacteriales bacterium]|nr:PQQ-binding-like beta-propeller repeat protein [Flavobacteriales bacterium]